MEGENQYSTQDIRVVPLKFDRIVEAKEHFVLEFKGSIVGVVFKSGLDPKLFSKLKSMSE